MDARKPSPPVQGDLFEALERALAHKDRRGEHEHPCASGASPTRPSPVLSADRPATKEPPTPASRAASPSAPAPRGTPSPEASREAPSPRGDVATHAAPSTPGTEAEAPASGVGFATPAPDTDDLEFDGSSDSFTWRWGLNHPLLPYAQTVDLIRRAQAGERAARDRVIAANQRLVAKIARNYHVRHATMDDLMAEGNVGLMRAVEKFDIDRGLQFSTYATWWIRAQIGNCVRENATIMGASQRSVSTAWALFSEEPRNEAATAALAELAAKLTPEQRENLRRLSQGVSSIDAPVGNGHSSKAESTDTTLHNYLGAEAEVQDPADDLHRARLAEVLLDSIDPDHRYCVEQHYGLNGRPSRTFSEIGLELGLSRQRVQQIVARAVQRMEKAASRQNIAHEDAVDFGM